MNVEDAWDRACSKGDVRLMAWLLESYGAGAAAADEDGCTRLMVASSSGHSAVVALLLAHGCGDLDRQELLCDWTALHQASLAGHAGVVRLLLGAGADAHVLDITGKTPLAIAVESGHGGCVEALKVWGCLFA
jgi:uncharacterized protein